MCRRLFTFAQVKAYAVQFSIALHSMAQKIDIKTHSSLVSTHSEIDSTNRKKKMSFGIGKVALVVTQWWWLHIAKKKRKRKIQRDIN